MVNWNQVFQGFRKFQGSLRRMGGKQIPWGGHMEFERGLGMFQEIKRDPRDFQEFIFETFIKGQRVLKSIQGVSWTSDGFRGFERSFKRTSGSCKSIQEVSMSFMELPMVSEDLRGVSRGLQGV